MPGRNLPSVLSSLACTTRLRVSTSSAGAMAVTVPAKLASGFLRHSKVKQQRSHLLQVNNRGTGCHILAQAHLTNAQHASKRGGNAQLVERGTVTGHSSSGHITVTLTGLQLLTTDGTGRSQFAGTFQLSFGQLQIG